MTQLKSFTLTIAFAIIGLMAAAQSTISTLGYNFQGYAIDPDGKALGNTAITVKFTIYNSGGPAFTEEQNLNSDAFGVFTAIVGNGSTVTNSQFAKIPFNKNKEIYFLRVEVKKTANGTFATVSDAQLASVPYARKADNGVPAGTIIAYGGSTVPDGWLYCDGSSYDPAAYPELAAAIGDSWGTKALPDLRGTFLRGDGNTIKIGGGDANPDRTSRAALKAGGNTGDNVGTYQNSEIISHNHGGTLTTSTDGNHNHNNGNYDRLVRSASVYNPGGSVGTIDGTHSNGVNDPDVTNSALTVTAGNHSHTVTLTPQGGTEARPFNAAVKYIIKY